MKKIALTIALLFVTSFVAIQAQQTINEKASQVDFKIKAGGLMNVKGTFTGMKGIFKLYPNDLGESGFYICVDASTVNTGNNKRDNHLRDPDFFEVEKYPKICFKSSSVTKTSDGYMTKGELTLHGVTKVVEIPFTFTNNTFVGTIVIDRFDYKLGEDFGTFKVGTEATVTITCVVK